MKNTKYTKELIERVVSVSYSNRECIENLGLTYSNGSRKMINKYYEKYNIDTSHFLIPPRTKRLSNDELFVENSNSHNSLIRSRLLKYNLTPYECQCCGNKGEWMDQKMPLILDHINGINNDNRLENLRFLCSNCDSIQPTYKSRNRNKGEKKIKIKNYILSQQRDLERLNKRNIMIERIKSMNLDYSVKNWGTKIAKELNISPQYALNIVKKYILTE